jgi:hypothetical protein
MSSIGSVEAAIYRGTTAQAIGRFQAKGDHSSPHRAPYFPRRHSQPL